MKNADNGTDTALTVVADESMKELLKSGNMKEIQKAVQEGTLPPSHSSGKTSGLSWEKGVIVGKYEIIRKIGKGGMGVIYLARHTQLESLRALKVLPAANADENPVFAERFIREARIASQIRHPNVVEVMDVERDDNLNVSYIVMEYVDGGSLRQILKGHSKLNIEQAVVTIQCVVSALCAAAERGIVHRDIKPDNIMFTKRGGVKLADLGIAKKEDEDDNLTKTNVMMGTPAYLSPEQVENPKAVDIRSDIYSLGATFYEILTGQVPYPGKSSYDILRKIFSDPVPDPRSLNAEIPPELAAVVMKMLAKDPRKRYQTPAELQIALAQLIPSLSDTDLQYIVKSIVSNGNKTAGGNNTCNSSFSGTLYNNRKQQKRKRILLIAACCFVLAAGWFVGGLISSPVKPASKTPPKRAEAGKPEKRAKEVAPLKVSAPVPAPAPVPKVRLSSLKIVTNPFATVRLIADNGQIFTYAGNSKGSFNITGLEAGEYQVELSCPDHIPCKRKLTLPLREPLKLPLQPDWKVLTMTGEAGIKVELFSPDGRKIAHVIPAGKTMKIPKLKKGSYRLKATLEHHFPVEKQLHLEKDTSLHLQMEKIYKKFTLTTQPGSQVELLQNFQLKYSGKADHKGKCFLPALKKGVYELKISAQNFVPHSSLLNVEKDVAFTIPLQKRLYSITLYGTAGAKGKMFAGKKLVRVLTISSSGGGEISKVVPGKYTLEFSCKGFQTQKHDIEVKENLTLQVNLLPVPAAQPAARGWMEERTMEGTLNIYLSAGQKMMDHIKRHGVEIMVGDEEWIRVKNFPVTRQFPPGEIQIGIRGNGIRNQAPRMVRIYSGKTADVLLEVQVKPSILIFSSNFSDTHFTLDGKLCPAGKEIRIEPFVQYKAVASYGGEKHQKLICSSLPGEKLEIPFTFIRRVHPMQRQYEAACNLVRNEKYKEALAALLPIAKANHPDAAMLTGWIYDKGKGMWFSRRSQALFWYHKAATLGVVKAAVIVADAIREEEYEGSEQEMLAFYLAAVGKNDPRVTYIVSSFYKNGWKSIKADEAKALYYLQKAAQLGYPDAMFDLGIRYEKGLGVPSNSKTFLYWIRKAAEKGHEKALRYQEQFIQ